MDADSQPMATYRLQFNQAFRFRDAQALVPYFSRLGITHLYASPVLRARQASSHGYDVVDPHTLNPNLGDKTDVLQLTTDLRKFGLRLVLDIVPNHMAASIENPYWRDVLTYGRSSPFAGWFDIDWRLPDPHMWGRVLFPVLGEPRSRVLDQQQIRLVWSDGRFLVQYFEHNFPIDPATVPTICDFGLSDLRACLPHDHPALTKIAEILTRLKKLPKLVARLRRRVHIDREETEQWLAQFAQIVVQSPRIQQWAEETAERFGQGTEGSQRLKRLLDTQPYRLVHWRDAARTINYRRFFDINELISIRQEDPHVFEETHSAVLRWVRAGLIDGLRIDHIDGLRDPRGYLERLTQELSTVERPSGPIPVFVEKILAPDEELPSSWPVAGTTGYEFLNQAEAVFVSPEGFSKIEQAYRRMLQRPVHFSHFATWGKRRILRNDLAPHVGRLADTLARLAESGKLIPSAASDVEQSIQVGASGSDGPATVTLPEQHTWKQRDLVDAIVEVITALPVYRTYVDSRHCELSEADRDYIEAALRGARLGGHAEPEAIDFLGEVLLLENRERLTEHDLYERVNFIQRFQQLTGPAAAKGVEDTALYAYVPLASLNEVGGEPHRPPDDAALVLHQANARRAETHPHTLLCVTTHDTKRTADVRARLDVLSEIPDLWISLVRRWRRLHRKHGTRTGTKHAPDAATEYLFYQTVVGLWPAPQPDRVAALPDVETLQDLHRRVEAYMLKAVREAKTHTSWTQRNAGYEDALVSFVRQLVLPVGPEEAAFLQDVQQLVSRIARPGFWNSLARTLVQFTAPGTPDLYQGDELWNFALVDPDNRQPVDYERRQRLLVEVATGGESPDPVRREFIRSLIDSAEDGRIKLHLIRSALATRREYASLFAKGRYAPLGVRGSAADHVIAFARMPGSLASPSESASQAAAVVVVPRLTATLVAEPFAAPMGEATWSDTMVRLPEPLRSRNWMCALTRERVGAPAAGDLKISAALSSFPAALLVSESRQPASPDGHSPSHRIGASSCET